MANARLKEDYYKEIRPQLQKDLGLKNIMQVPRLTKIVLNVGVKEAVGDSRVLQTVADILAKIAGQQPVKTMARKSIAGFKIREGMPLGVMVTLRQKNMYDFLDRLVNLALPQVRDFKGVKSRCDGRGNYNLGIKDWIIFPEVDYDNVNKFYGLNVTICTTAESDEHTVQLLKKFGMPFAQEGKGK